MIFERALVLGFEHDFSVFGFAEGCVLMDELSGLFAEIVVLPSGVGKSLNELEGAHLSNPVVALEFFSQCLHQNQLPGVLKGHSPNWLQSLPVDRDSVIDRNNLESSIDVGDENVLARRRVVLGYEQAAVMGSGKEAEFVEAVRRFLGIGWPAGLGVEIEEEGTVGNWVEGAQSADNDVIVVFELDAEVDLVLILVEFGALIVGSLLLQVMDFPVAGSIGEAVVAADLGCCSLSVVLEVEGVFGLYS